MRKPSIAAMAYPAFVGAMSEHSPTNLRDLRVSYELAELVEASAPADPYELFRGWLQDALIHQLPEPNAMTLATVGLDGGPSARTVLLKGLDMQGFHFFTNYHSRKGEELAANPRAAAVFLWADRHRQVNIRGVVSKLPREEAESYFVTRPHGHQVGAWVSDQSQVIPGREWLETRLTEVSARFAGNPVPCPPHWGGYALQPDEIEFWQGRVSRLHDRLRYTRAGDSWKIERLSP